MSDTCDLCGAPTHDSAPCDTCAWDVARDAEDQMQHEARRDAR